MAFEAAFPADKTKSLLMKYNIPISHLSYEYIRNCSDIKKLEKIVKILKSGEEGFYPDLQKEAEDRLRNFSPNNILLREEVAVLTKQSMSKLELNTLLEDLSNWKEEIAEYDLRLVKEKDSQDDEDSLVPVRRIAHSKCQKKDTLAKTPINLNRICDYANWDKYDVDSELLRMDLDEEKQKEIKQCEKREQKEARIENITKQADKYTESERKVLAEQEIVRGNEYYKVGDFEEAIKFYTASIAIWRTAKAFNNRAACYLMQSNYSAVLKDTDSVLTIEPGNIKALYRRSIARQKKNLFVEAFQDISEVLKKQPTNSNALQIAEQLKNEFLSSPAVTASRTNADYLNTKDLEKPSTSSRSWTAARPNGDCFDMKDLEKPSTSGTSWTAARTNQNCFNVKDLEKPSTSGICWRTRPLSSPASTLKIVELSEESQTSKVSKRLEIIEVE